MKKFTVQDDKLYLILCEGDADSAFLRNLQEHRKSFPNVQIQHTGGINGLTGFLNGLYLDPLVKQLKGILVIFDTADDADVTFRKIKKQIASTEFKSPAKLFDIKPKATIDDIPYITVTLIPDDQTPGGLETLCNVYLESKYSWIKQCINAFLSCGSSTASTWSAEKLDKSRFAAMIAVTNEEGPGKALSRVFSSDTGTAPVIPVSPSCFDDVERRIKEFCAKAV